MYGLNLEQIVEVRAGPRPSGGRSDQWVTTTLIYLCVFVAAAAAVYCYRPTTASVFHSAADSVSGYLGLDVAYNTVSGTVPSGPQKDFINLNDHNIDTF